MECLNWENVTHVELIGFLSFLYQKGSGYSALNSARSAVSTVVSLFTAASPIRAHPLVSRFMKGVFQSRPSVPRYNNTWDADVVLKYLDVNVDKPAVQLICSSKAVASITAIV